METSNPKKEKKDKIDATFAVNQFVETNGRTLAYRSIGKGMPIILANRFRGILDYWDPAFLNALAKSFNVITFDYSGFGLSTGEANRTILNFAQDVKDLADALNLKKIVVGGWSFGGMVAQTVVTQFPELVSYAVLIGTNPPGANEGQIEPIFFERSRIMHYSIEDETILFFEPEAERSRQAAVRSHERIAKRTEDLDVMIPPELWDTFTTGIQDYIADPYNSRAAILTTAIPMLVITGDHDLCFPAENWFKLVRTILNTQIIVFPKAGHGPHHEHPKQVARYIKNFIRYTEPA